MVLGLLSGDVWLSNVVGFLIFRLRLGPLLFNKELLIAWLLLLLLLLIGLSSSLIYKLFSSLLDSSFMKFSLLSYLLVFDLLLIPEATPARGTSVLGSSSSFVFYFILGF